ncbi:flagellar basal body P-ring formation chaperone FlgA [Acidocella sp.]|uniref:flagellar basal body P-ring formation chaperone FlgA n=1 Tax=Acidocella sp. TaxID=50710 RepID=UPI00261DDC77|nr:flagellar basal body P-ring formation chaperone FlgA [Acidocella sp.]
MKPRGAGRLVRLWCLAAAGFGVLAGPAIAEPPSGESPQAVAVAVKNAVLPLTPPGATLQIGAVDGVAYMSACAVPLAVSVSGVIPYEQAAVRCARPSWVFYVQVKVAQSERVVVAARPIVAGSVIGAKDLMMLAEPVEKFAGRQVFYDTAPVIGAEALMSIAAGVVVSQQNIQQPVLIKAGQQVMVTVESGGIAVTLLAVADQDGRAGDLILLTNPTSGRRFSAMVTADGPVINLR